LRLNGFKKKKLHGEVIPTEVVKSIFAQHFKSISHNFKDTVDNFLADISAKHKFTNEDMASYKGKLIKSINKSIEEGVTESKKSIRSIVKEYSEKRGKGERTV